MAEFSRRGAVAAFTVLPRHVLGGHPGQAPSDRLNLAGVGVGGMGANYLRNCESENVAALCDVDDAVAAKTFARYPQAKTYRDFRVMLEKEKGIDAVVIGTPDHTHAFVALAAMELGKHVYCAKPLTRTAGGPGAGRGRARAAGGDADERAVVRVEWRLFDRRVARRRRGGGSAGDTRVVGPAHLAAGPGPPAGGFSGS
ncbi:MAG: Gfo/Idh/MocA family protein [Bryobacteraceae bacterium]